MAFEKFAAGVRRTCWRSRSAAAASADASAIQPSFAGLERRVAFLRARIIDAVGVEGLRLPFRRRDLVHARRGCRAAPTARRAPVAFLQAIVARLFGGTLIDADAAPAHLMHHRQQIDVEPIGVAGALLVEDRVQVLK